MNLTSHQLKMRGVIQAMNMEDRTINLTLISDEEIINAYPDDDMPEDDLGYGLRKVAEAQLAHNIKEAADYYRSLTPEEVREKVAMIICENCEHQDKTDYSCTKQLPCVYAEGLANQINSLYMELLEEGKK